MNLFRTQTPKHQPNRSVCTHYKSYLKTLKKDFNYRCGYCNDPLELAHRSFVIDHFVPQKPDSCVSHIPPNRYRNLVYSCSTCNGAKLNKWPTGDSKIANDGKRGFMIPTNPGYGKLFYRDKSGAIQPSPKNALSRYIRKELKLWWPTHALYWQCEEFQNQEKQLEQLLSTMNNMILKKQLEVVKLQRLAVLDAMRGLINVQ